MKFPLVVVVVVVAAAQADPRRSLLRKRKAKTVTIAGSILSRGSSSLQGLLSRVLGTRGEEKDRNQSGRIYLTADIDPSGQEEELYVAEMLAEQEAEELEASARSIETPTDPVPEEVEGEVSEAPPVSWAPNPIEDLVDEAGEDGSVEIAVEPEPDTKDLGTEEEEPAVAAQEEEPAVGTPVDPIPGDAADTTGQGGAKVSNRASRTSSGGQKSGGDRGSL